MTHGQQVAGDLVTTAFVLKTDVVVDPIAVGKITVDKYQWRIDAIANDATDVTGHPYQHKSFQLPGFGKSKDLIFVAGGMQHQIIMSLSRISFPWHPRWPKKRDPPTPFRSGEVP